MGAEGGKDTPPPASSPAPQDMASGQRLAEGGGAREEHGDWLVETHFEEIDSTQNYVEREHERFDQGRLTAVSADFQTAGKGTRDRSWEAVHGQSVLVTFFFRFPPECPTPFVNKNVANVTKVLALATVDALNCAAGANPRSDPALRVGMKWPNDVVANGHKIAGILARAVPSPGARMDGVILGVGVNINQTQAEMDLIKRPVWPATSLRAITGDKEAFDVAEVRRRLVRRFASELKVFFEQGFPALKERVNRLEVLMGSEVRFRVSEQEQTDGTFAGVDDEGLIIIRAPDGSTRSYPSGEIVPRGP